MGFSLLTQQILSHVIVVAPPLLLKPGTEKSEIRNVEMRKWPGTNEGFTDRVG